MLNRIKSYETDSRRYVLDLSEQELKRGKRISMLYILGAAAAHIGMGMVNQASSRTAWIVFPYLIVFLPLCYAIMGAASFMRAKLCMSAVQYHEGLLRMRRSLLAVFVLECFGVLTEILFIVMHRGQIPLAGELLYLVLHLLPLLLIALYGRFYDRWFARIRTED